MCLRTYRAFAKRTPGSGSWRNADLSPKAICGQAMVLSKGGRPVQRQVVRLTRQELYEKMWSRPAVSLAEEFGISGRGLGKICSRFEIPVPPRGYRAKLAAGKHVTRAQLPTAKSDVPSEILIQPSPEGPAAALPEQVRAEVTTARAHRAFRAGRQIPAR